MQIQLKGNRYHLAHPPVLAVAVCAAAALVMLGGVLLRISGLLPLQATAAYTTAGAFMLLYSVGTSARLLTVPRYWLHAQRSFLFFLTVFLALGVLAYLFSGLTLSEAKGYRSAYLTLLIGEIILICMGIFVRSVIVWLEQDDRDGSPR